MYIYFHCGFVNQEGNKVYIYILLYKNGNFNGIVNGIGHGIEEESSELLHLEHSFI
jgi:multidrug resistance efflux pump